jgi:hypothetical protein
MFNWCCHLNSQRAKNGEGVKATAKKPKSSGGGNKLAAPAPVMGTVAVPDSAATTLPPLSPSLLDLVLDTDLTEEDAVGNPKEFWKKFATRVKNDAVENKWNKVPAP